MRFRNLVLLSYFVMKSRALFFPGFACALLVMGHRDHRENKESHRVHRERGLVGGRLADSLFPGARSAIILLCELCGFACFLCGLCVELPRSIGRGNEIVGLNAADVNRSRRSQDAALPRHTRTRRERARLALGPARADARMKCPVDAIREQRHTR